MSALELSIVVPAFNEEACIADCVRRWTQCLDRASLRWELIVVDDGSSDRTGAIVEELAASDGRVRLIRHGRRGKGAAVRDGMLAARGTWRFMADADLSMPPDNIQRFFAVVSGSAPTPHIAAGSREAPGARRIGEPFRRHAIGRLFNAIVRCVAVPGIDDTQCGFKLFSGELVDVLFPHTKLDGLAFDVEVLFLALQARARIVEVGIEWHCRVDSRINVWRGASAFLDILRVRWYGLRGCYRNLPPAPVLAVPHGLRQVWC
jgi:glycosyltransferase involved in cell wall biosynthesis